MNAYKREVLAIEIGLNLPASRGIRVLKCISTWRGYSARLRMDSGPEYTSIALADWAEHHGISLEFIKPDKPTQNCWVECFSRTYRDEILYMQFFRNLGEVLQVTE